MLSTAGLVLLPVDRNVTAAFWLQRSVHGITLRDELVEPESECREAGFGVALTGVACQQSLPCSGSAAFLFNPRELAQFASRTVRSFYALRRGSHKAAARVGSHSKGALNPDGQRVLDEFGKSTGRTYIGIC